MFKFISCPIFGAILLTLMSATWAKDYQLSNKGVITEISFNTGLLNGQSGEYVYDAYGLGTGIPGYKVSQLDWGLKNVPMLGIGYSIIPNKRIRLKADYWTNVSKGEATMDDYDWLYIGNDWSHWSHHDNTSAEASSIDLSAEITVYSFIQKNAYTREKFSILAIVGYKQEQLNWESVGGWGIYSVNSYRDSYVIFPNIPGISYEQSYKTPYIGLGMRATNIGDQTTLKASVRYSNRVHGEDIDYHHLRDLRFDESGDQGKWLSYDLKIDFKMSKSLMFNLGYSTQHYSEIKATTVVTNLLTNVKTLYSGDAAGLDHRSSLLSLGVTYQF